MLFKKNPKGPARFRVKSTDHLSEIGRITILVDLETGVNYIQTWVGTSGGITPLLDSNGEVVIDPVEGNRS